MYKYSCLGFNKSVFNWTFCQLHYSQKKTIAQKTIVPSYPSILESVSDLEGVGIADLLASEDFFGPSRMSSSEPSGDLSVSVASVGLKLMIPNGGASVIKL